jgi:hypothetical protein
MLNRGSPKPPYLVLSKCLSNYICERRLFFLFLMLKFHKPQHFLPCLGNFSMSNSALNWFRNVLTYNGKLIEY